MQGYKDYKLLRQGIAAYRDPSGIYVYLVAAGFTVASLPYLTAGVSSSPALEARGCFLTAFPKLGAGLILGYWSGAQRSLIRVIHTPHEYAKSCSSSDGA